MQFLWGMSSHGANKILAINKIWLLFLKVSLWLNGIEQNELPQPLGKHVAFLHGLLVYQRVYYSLGGTSCHQVRLFSKHFFLKLTSHWQGLLTAQHLIRGQKHCYICLSLYRCKVLRKRLQAASDYRHFGETGLSVLQGTVPQYWESDFLENNEMPFIQQDCVWLSIRVLYILSRGLWC